MIMNIQNYVLRTITPCDLVSTQLLKMSIRMVKAAGTYGWRPTTLVVPKRQENQGS